MKNVLLIVVDCLREDKFFKCQDHHISDMMENGVYFSNTITSATVTTPSFASLLTSLYPFQHGMLSLKDCKLPDSCTTLPCILSENGYTTKAFFTGPLLPETSLNKGFDFYEYRSQDSFSDETKKRIINDIKSTKGPWFAAIHFWDLHSPIFLENLSEEEREGLTYEQTYELALKNINKILKEFKEETNPDLMIITGDHGDRLNEELKPEDLRRVRLRPRHGFHIYDYLIKVPLLFCGEDIPKIKSNSQVRNIDIFPTILNYLGIKYNSKLISGENLFTNNLTNRPALCTASSIIINNKEEWIEGIKFNNFKLFHKPFNKNQEKTLIDSSKDTEESNNIIEQNPEIAEKLENELKNIKKNEIFIPNKQNKKEENKMLKKLKDLGYI